LDSPRKYSWNREQAAALLIVLAMVVLATGLVVAYFSRVTSDRPVAHSSFNQLKVDQLAQSAMDNVIGDFRQEIINGSASPAPTFGPSSNPGPFNLYVPVTTANIVPVRSPTATPGTTPAIPNLIRRSVRSDTIPSPARASRASAVNSMVDVSANGRSVTLARWNSHYMIPKLNLGDAGSDPVTTGFSAPNYWAPDWVYVTLEYGADVLLNPNTDSDGRPVTPIGRYAYMIYDEGGLLDMNAAGYPSVGTPLTVLQYGRKGSLAFADLTGLPGLSTATDNIVGWRNYASAEPSGSFPSFSFNANSANTYYDFILSDPNYIQLLNYLPNPTPTPLNYFTNFFLTTAWQASWGPQYNSSQTVQTDQGFNTRQSLLKLRSSLSGGGIGFVNALQYLGTSSREALASAPQWTGPSPTPTSTNPNFQTLLVTQQFTRSGGSTAYVGDYLVNKRFLLQRLNWLTYKGPSATRNIPTSAPPLGDPDYDMWLLTRPDLSSIRFELTSSFLRLGTDLSIPGSNSETAYIYKYFGLVWDATNERWNYIGHPDTPTATSPPASSIAGFGPGGTNDPNTVPTTRELDFFELLQAGLLSGSVGDSVASYPELPTSYQGSQMLHILTIGANLIAQSRVDSYPVRVACTVTVGGTPTVMEAVGIPRLPCVNSLAACPVGIPTTTLSGGMNWLLVPNLWDPFRDTWDLTETNSGNTGNKPLSTPGYLRPPVRIVVKGTGPGGSATIGFGAVAAVTSSGRIDPVTNPVTLLSSVTFNPLSLEPFQTGQVTPPAQKNVGRDGFLEAMRMGVSDVTPTPTPFNPTAVGSTTAPSWNGVARPQNDNSNTLRTDDYAVFRLSANIPASTTGYPVLILYPGFQVEMEYQSPNGNWYPYSFLQGNNATNTWISSNLNLATSYSKYGTPPGNSAPTIVNATGPANTVTRWDQVTNGRGGVGALAQAPMFAKADPRSIRYNTQIGALTVSGNSAGVIGSIWPSGYATPPPMPPGTSNPAIYSQTTGDNAPGATNPYSESNGDAVRPVMVSRPFRSVGEMGYAFRDQPFRTLSFSSTNSPDAGLLDLFTTVAYGPTPTPSPSPSITPTYPTPTATPRGGVISLNSLQAPSLAAVLTGTIAREDTPRSASGASPSPSPVSAILASNTATSLVLSTSSAPVVNRAGLAALIAPTPNASPSPSILDASVPKTQREAVVRALGEVDQTRTWNLMIDVIAQSGRYPPNATSFQNGFVVEGEQRYWVHVAIDRFTGQVIDKQIEVVTE
jgi:hypothetical protein